MRRCTLAALLAGLAACGTVATAPDDSARLSSTPVGRCVTDAAGSIRTTEVTVPERGTDAPLSARVFAPVLDRRTASCPIIAVLPGGGAGVENVAWAAERLAAAGYVVAVVRPSRGGSVDAYHVAAMSALDFLASAANPYRAIADTGRVGVAGYSLGARALTRTQAEDPRIDALVAWDNLAVSEQGDAGSPACQNVPGVLRAPRVPALGQASETCPGAPRDAKLTAFAHWRAAGVPAMQVVFAGATHFAWSAAATEAEHALADAYTRAWFDRWLLGDPTATERLLGPTAPGLPDRPVGAALSARFRSAAAFDGRTCEELRKGC